MFPSPTQVGSLRSLADLRSHYNVADVVWTAFVEKIGDPGDDLRLVGSLPSSAIAAACELAELSDGSSFSAVQASQVGLVYRLANRLLHVQAGGDWATWHDCDPWATVAPPVATQTQPPTCPSPTERKLKMTTVLDQGDESEFLMLNESMVSKAWQHYRAIMGTAPLEEEEPTAEQLSALHRRCITLGNPPHADFAIWVPYGRRAMRASKFRTYIATESGYTAKELPGPSNYVQWRASYRVWKTALIMLDISSLASLNTYEAFIERLVYNYPGTWRLIYSAEDMARSEQMGRMRSRLQALASSNGTLPDGWDPQRPWDYIIKALQDEDRFWREHVHMPALAWLANGQRGSPRTPIEKAAMTYMKDGLHAISVPTEEASHQGKSSSSKERREARKRKASSEKEELQKLRAGAGGGSQGQHHQGKGGGGKGKSKGSQLCYAWNDGTGACAGLVPGAECKSTVKREH